MPKTIALTGGGTGGHTFPLLALANHLENNEEYAFIWMGEKAGLEEKIAEEAEIEFKSIKAGKFRRYFSWKNFYEPLLNIVGFFQSIFYLYHYNIDGVFSKGGFVSLPLCFAAFVMRKKIYIHESDTVAGISNKMIGKFATKIFYTFPNEKIDNKKHILTGQILNPKLFNKINTHEILEENDELEVLVIAGSQGSTIIFENLINILPSVKNMNFTIILGDKNLHFREKFSKFKNVKTLDFVTQDLLKEIYKKTDISITRAGATTLWELYFFGIHSIIIPLSSAAGNHQELNADYFTEMFGSDKLDENHNLKLDLLNKLTKYVNLRKRGLNTTGYNYALQRIEKELD
ncbi:MAG: glycosyltransferase [Candidatus Gracilibacteria bacterium]|nr:glycosyltransferase [Candidatus Gracilibacteria bacterium]